ncbi:hypothetical protein [Lyngbya confervoides]|uniref:DALR anticodon binding domain-containing protein n=1 Tax=Lyngbya confervoides BDU141951 TaxID=1574623 RepID=A0ABD4SZD0_9CYAN|nr:hypothetical protein [Lyngbya confervoides]MCM1981506.1 hypothetical protein [Lyngbya confervoides BDU141951]
MFPGFDVHCQLWYPSPVPMLLAGLAIAAQEVNVQGDRSAVNLVLEPHPHTWGIYRTPLALQLPQVDPAVLLVAFQSWIQAQIPDQAAQIQSRVDRASGWIDIRVADVLQEFCLNQALQHPPRLQHLTLASTLPAGRSLKADPFWGFEWAYAHARCCSLLRLAQDHELFHRWSRSVCFPPAMRAQPDCAEGQILRSLCSFPLQFQRTYCASQLRLVPSTAFWQQPLVLPWPISRARALSQTWLRLFQQFYGQCRLFGLSERETEDWLDCRITLLHLLQQVLRVILVDLQQQQAPEIL